MNNPLARDMIEATRLTRPGVLTRQLHSYKSCCEAIGFPARSPKGETLRARPSSFRRQQSTWWLKSKTSRMWRLFR